MVEIGCSIYHTSFQLVNTSTHPSRPERIPLTPWSHLVGAQHNRVGFRARVNGIASGLQVRAAVHGLNIVYLGRQRLHHRKGVSEVLPR